MSNNPRWTNYTESQSPRFTSFRPDGSSSFCFSSTCVFFLVSFYIRLRSDAEWSGPQSTSWSVQCMPGFVQWRKLSRCRVPSLAAPYSVPRDLYKVFPRLTTARNILTLQQLTPLFLYSPCTPLFSGPSCPDWRMLWRLSIQVIQVCVLCCRCDHWEINIAIDHHWTNKPWILSLFSYLLGARQPMALTVFEDNGDRALQKVPTAQIRSSFRARIQKTLLATNCAYYVMVIVRASDRSL